MKGGGNAVLIISEYVNTDIPRVLGWLVTLRVYSDD